MIAQRVLDASAIGGGTDGEGSALQGGGEKGGVFALPTKDKLAPQSKKRRDPLLCAACLARPPLLRTLITCSQIDRAPCSSSESCIFCAFPSRATPAANGNGNGAAPAPPSR